MTKSLVLICDNSPIGKNSVSEAFRLASGIAAIDETVDRTLVLVKDAVNFFLKNLRPEQVGMDNFKKFIQMAEFTNLRVLIDKDDLKKRGFSSKDLIDYEHLKIASKKQIGQVFGNADASFRL